MFSANRIREETKEAFARLFSRVYTPVKDNDKELKVLIEKIK